MKKITFFLIVIMCFCLVGCSEGKGADKIGLDFDNDGNDDFKVHVPAPVIHTVHFQTNGGTAVDSKKIVSLESAPFTEREGHEFRGWYRDESCQIPAVYPLDIDADMILYAKWLKISDQAKCNPVSFKNKSASFQINPPSLDLATLASEGYKIRIDVQYDVSYEKDYDVLWDIGYFGAPKFEVYIHNSDDMGVSDEGIKASTYWQTRNITYTSTASNMMNTMIYLKFSSDNVQNILLFDDIQITYTCYK